MFFHFKNNLSVVSSSCVHYLNKSPLTISEELWSIFYFQSTFSSGAAPQWDAAVNRPVVSLMARLGELTECELALLWPTSSALSTRKPSSPALCVYLSVPLRLLLSFPLSLPLSFPFPLFLFLLSSPRVLAELLHKVSQTIKVRLFKFCISQVLFVLLFRHLSWVQ